MVVNRKKTIQRVRDPVHGLIVFGENGDDHRKETDRIAWALLNTREFQRLRRIRQLGFSDLVFPGATHSRLAHSLGVYHMARRLADIIQKRSSETRDENRERVALLAALLHDIGHGPFSHVFEQVATGRNQEFRKHERWSAEIVRNEETEVNRILRSFDENLPVQIGDLLTDEGPRDIYSAIVSSQFDADRLDYIQRDRLMTGAEFGHIDSDWLLDCLNVGRVTIGTESDSSVVQCLYLSPKGLQVAEEYLEARYRLYRRVYMHKTTRSAEKMLQMLLTDIAGKVKNDEFENGDDKTLAGREPVMRHLTSESPCVQSYLSLDDSKVWSSLSVYSEFSDRQISELATRILNRNLYKCVDVGAFDAPDGNLRYRFLNTLKDSFPLWKNEFPYDDEEIRLYRWYDFDDTSVSNKILVKMHESDDEPKDIINESEIAKALPKGSIWRIYAPSGKVDKLRKILRDLRG